MRVESPTTHPLWTFLRGVDPKHVLRGAATAATSPDSPLRPADLEVFEWRTFCCVRDGQVVRTCASVGADRALWSFSGHADCPVSGRSNIGFQVGWA